MAIGSWLFIAACVVTLPDDILSNDIHAERIAILVMNLYFFEKEAVLKQVTLVWGFAQLFLVDNFSLIDE